MGGVFSWDLGRVGDGYKGTGRKVNKANPCEGGGSSSNHEDDGRHEDEGHDDDGGGNVNIVMTEDYQSLKRRMREVEDCLECSACFMVPRKLPIPSCPSGHLICGDCRGKVEDKCPTCRQMLRKGDVSSLAAALYDKVEHRCKFPCEVKALLRDILVHEKKCPERIIKCPGRCGKEIKLKNFHDHCIENDENYDCFVTLDQTDDTVSIRLMRMRRDAITFKPFFFQNLDKKFFLFVRYEKFMLKVFVMIAEDPEMISQYTAITIFSGHDQMCNENANKLVLQTKLVPVEDNFYIKDNFKNGLKIDNQTLKKLCSPFSMTEERRVLSFGVDIKVELTKND